MADDMYAELPNITGIDKKIPMADDKPASNVHCEKYDILKFDFSLIKQNNFFI